MRKDEQNIDGWCDFCGFGTDKQWADDWAIIDQTHTEHLVTILFCPMCGRQLTEGLEVANENHND